MIDTADTLLYPAHLMIGGWRLLFGIIAISLIAGCQIFWWFFTNIQQHGFMSTWFEAAKIAGESPLLAIFVGLLFVVSITLLLLPLTRGFTGLLVILWNRIFGFRRKPGRYTPAEIIQRGLDPDDFDFEKIDGVIYGRRRGAAIWGKG